MNSLLCCFSPVKDLHCYDTPLPCVRDAIIQASPSLSEKDFSPIRRPKTLQYNPNISPFVRRQSIRGRKSFRAGGRQSLENSLNYTGLESTINEPKAKKRQHFEYYKSVPLALNEQEFYYKDDDHSIDIYDDSDIYQQSSLNSKRSEASSFDSPQKNLQSAFENNLTIDEEEEEENDDDYHIPVNTTFNYRKYFKKNYNDHFSQIVHF